MKRAVIGLVPAFLATMVLVAQAEAPSATAVVCLRVEDRTPVGAGATFPVEVGELMCFSELRGVTGTIHHVWFHGDQSVRDIELTVKAERWRTWSVKRISPAAVGDWRVEVRTGDGTVLATAGFKIE
ncbi:MAG: DUF2914 domain-containing protein [Acidobacteria bacterium]|nr:DUF2914 domain-containing protein [Acidobacteriota bacterium]